MKSKIIQVTISLFAILLFSSYHAQVAASKIAEGVSPKSKALAILQNKCNVCHIDKNRSKIFTAENMDRHTKKINRQVFITKKMPKGDDIKLTDEEYLLLKIWIEEQLKK